MMLNAAKSIKIEPAGYWFESSRGSQTPDAGSLRRSQSATRRRKDVTWRWARALRSTWPDADGLLYASAMTGQRCVALWTPAQDAFPAAPAFARSIDVSAPRWQATPRDAAAQLGYTYA